MKFLTLLIFLSGVTFSNCESSKKVAAIQDTKTSQETMSTDATTNAKRASQDIMGSWEWVKTDCCGRTSKTTLADPNDEKRVISFDKDGTAMFYTSDPEGRMAKQKFTLGTMGTQPTIKIGELRPAIFTIKDDMLVLNWGYMDLQIEYYKKVTK